MNATYHAVDPKNTSFHDYQRSAPLKFYFHNIFGIHVLLLRFSREILSMREYKHILLKQT